MDGDSRGGAALSMKSVSGRPVKFISTGEKMDALEPFYPERVASRILGKHKLRLPPVFLQAEAAADNTMANVWHKLLG